MGGRPAWRGSCSGLSWVTMKRMVCRRASRGLTLIELLVVVAIVGILAAMALTLYASQQPRARIAKAQADTRAIAAGLTIYMGHCGARPPSGGESLGGLCNGFELAALNAANTTGDGTVVTAP